MALKEPRHLEWDDRLPEADREKVAQLNEALVRISGLRAVAINISGPFARSMISWKLATWQHALLHRIVALMDGVAVAWNNRCTLSAMLSARAFMETLAVLYDMESQVRRLLNDKDLGGLYALAHRGTFSTRNPDLVKESPDTAAINVLTLIDKVDKAVGLYRQHYDSLSERCHPNALGHYFLFAKLDHSDGSVQYGDEHDAAHNANMVLAAVIILPLAENLSKRLDNLIQEVSDLHHRIAPGGDFVPNAGTGDSPTS